METDYIQKQKSHMEVAKDLLQGIPSAWFKLLKELGGIPGKGGYLIQHYEKRLRD